MELSHPESAWKEEWDTASQLQRRGFFFPGSRVLATSAWGFAPSYPLDGVERGE